MCVCLVVASDLYIHFFLFFFSFVLGSYLEVALDMRQRQILDVHQLQHRLRRRSCQQLAGRGRRKEHAHRQN